MICYRAWRNENSAAFSLTWRGAWSSDRGIANKLHLIQNEVT